MRKNKSIQSLLLSYSGKFSSMSYSGLSRVSMDPRNKSEDDCYKNNESADDKRECALEDDCYKKMSPRMTIMMWILVSSLTMTNMVYAECTPTPDCASIGYTETSCEGDSLKCPFDISKLFCIPCDTSFKYDCFGDNITGGVGSACNGKYAACTCSGGGVFNNGSCPQSCTVGMIYYSDGSCSFENDSTKTAVGFVVKDNELIASNFVSTTFELWGSDIVGLANLSAEDAQQDMDGKANTAAIVAELGTANTNNPVIYCYNYTGEMSGTAGKWYLPAAGEIYEYVYNNSTILKQQGLLWDGEHYPNWFRTSTEYESGGVGWNAIISNNILLVMKPGEMNSLNFSCFLEID